MWKVIQNQKIPYAMQITFGNGRERKWRAIIKGSGVAVVNVESLFYAVILKLKDEITGYASNYT